jgi:hypothetical protein
MDPVVVIYAIVVAALILVVGIIIGAWIERWRMSSERRLINQAREQFTILTGKLAIERDRYKSENGDLQWALDRCSEAIAKVHTKAIAPKPAPSEPFRKG